MIREHGAPFASAEYASIQVRISKIRTVETLRGWVFGDVAGLENYSNGFAKLCMQKKAMN